MNYHTKNVPAILPAQCLANPYVHFTAARAAVGLAVMAAYVERQNLTAVPCGLCSYRVSCATSCSSPRPRYENRRYMRYGEKFRGNRYGATDQLCFEQREHAACVMDPEYALDHRTGLCQPWPPLPWHSKWVHQRLPQPRGLHKHVTHQLTPFFCMNVAGRCYCCCRPYRPDPCTGRCVYDPPSYEAKLTNQQIYDICEKEYARDPLDKILNGYNG